jgi:hypothetical protein
MTHDDYNVAWLIIGIWSAICVVLAILIWPLSEPKELYDAPPN